MTRSSLKGVTEMRISFDLDDTLFVNPLKAQTEKELRFPWNRKYRERLRFGTGLLFDRLRAMGAEIWIYTTSFRSERYIRGLFKRYGIKLDGIVNGERHSREVQRDKKEPMPSKYPSFYKIGLHIDDDISVFQNGRQYGFKVLIINESDELWQEKVIEYAERLIKKQN